MVVVASPGVELCTIRDENSAGSLEAEIPVGVGRDSDGTGVVSMTATETGTYVYKSISDTLV